MRAFYDVDVPAAEWVEYGEGGTAAASDGVAFVSPPADQPIAIGAAMAWALRHDADRLHLFVDVGGAAERDAGAAARRGSLFRHPVAVFLLDGREVAFAEAAPPEPVLVPAPTTEEQRLLLEQAALDVIVEDGEVLGEVLGLEVAHVVVDADGTSRLEVGVGRFDREAFALMNGDLSPPKALARAIEHVAAVRRPGAEPHPINRVARGRWLRHVLIADPGLVDAVTLRPADPSRPRVGLRDRSTAIAVGERADGSPVVVAASVGVDLEAVPDAADARLRHAPDADLVLVVPPGDDQPITCDLAAHLARPASVVTIPAPWPT